MSSHVRKRAAIYVRISADREGTEYGVARQEEDCRKLADRLRLKVVAVYPDDDISASTKSRKQRPSYQRLLADARVGMFDVIIAYTSSRLTRKPREHEDLIELAEQHGIQYHYVKSPSVDLNTANGRMVARMLAAADANEAEQTSERIAREVQQRAQRGEFHGGQRPYCYEPDGVTIRQSEVKVFMECLERLLAGESQITIVRDLNDRGVPSNTGGKWTTPNFKKVMLKKRYVIGYEDGSGIREHDGVEYKAVWKGIITRQQHELLQARYRSSRQPWASGQATGRKYLLSGLTRCGTCGAAMFGQCRKLEGDKRQRRYRCKGLDNYGKEVGCGKVFRDANALDEFVTECVLTRFDSPDIAKVLAPKEDAGRAEELTQELTALNIRRKTLAVEHALKPYEDYPIMRQTIMAEIQRVERELAKLQTTKAQALLPANQPLRLAWEEASLEWKRDVIKLVVEKIVILPGAPGGARWNGYRFDVEKVQILWLV